MSEVIDSLYRCDDQNSEYSWPVRLLFGYSSIWIPLTVWPPMEDDIVKFRSLLLGSTAALVTVVATQVADTVLAESEQSGYVKV